ncbi:hypothetical protein SMC26_22550 [Actinomadura fulvescens]|uniref:Uncharacterized protein n=1 Tax=Actinomadura fulvescens TaxID=46160 RepID=A0ABP6D3R6_9ACTN
MPYGDVAEAYRLRVTGQHRADRRGAPDNGVDATMTLVLAPQRSEHVACAGGGPVMGVGEVTFARGRGQWLVYEISNQSTGYCPDVTSWTAVEAALDRAGIDHPHAFTHPIEFRRCPRCRQRNIVKDDHFVCAVCQAPLPSSWNVDEPDDEATGFLHDAPNSMATRNRQP